MRAPHASDHTQAVPFHGRMGRRPCVHPTTPAHPPYAVQHPLPGQLHASRRRGSICAGCGRRSPGRGCFCGHRDAACRWVRQQRCQVQRDRDLITGAGRFRHGQPGDACSDGGWRHRRLSPGWQGTSCSVVSSSAPPVRRSPGLAAPLELHTGGSWAEAACLLACARRARDAARPAAASHLTAACGPRNGCCSSVMSGAGARPSRSLQHHRHAHTHTHTSASAAIAHATPPPPPDLPSFPAAPHTTSCSSSDAPAQPAAHPHLHSPLTPLPRSASRPFPPHTAGWCHIACTMPLHAPHAQRLALEHGGLQTHSRPPTPHLHSPASSPRCRPPSRAAAPPCSTARRAPCAQTPTPHPPPPPPGTAGTS